MKENLEQNDMDKDKKMKLFQIFIDFGTRRVEKVVLDWKEIALLLGAGRILGRVSRQVVAVDLGARIHRSRGVRPSAGFRYLPRKWGRRSSFSSSAWLPVQRLGHHTVTPRFLIHH